MSANHMSVVVFDCESDGRPAPAYDGAQRGVEEFRNVQCTVACAIVMQSSTTLDGAREITCWRDVAPQKGANPFKELFDAFDEADVILAYNSFDFDFPLLWKHYGAKAKRRYFEHRLKSVDIFSRLRAATNRWPKLADLLSDNGLSSKTGSGANAINLWEAGQRDELESYCMADVKLTAQLGLLPRMRMADLWVPQHVYGIGPALAANAATPPDSDTN